MAELAASDGRDNLILLDAGVKGFRIQHMLPIHFLGHHAAMLAGLTQNTLSLGNLQAGLFGVGIGPLYDLMPTPVGNDNASHVSGLLILRRTSDAGRPRAREEFRSPAVSSTYFALPEMSSSAVMSLL